MGGRRGMAAMIVLALLALAGCGDDGEAPAPAPSGGAETSPGATEATSAAPKLGPVETVRAWVKAYNELARSGDATDVTRVGDARCRMCSSLTDALIATHAVGGAYRGGAWQIAGIGIARRTKAGVIVDAAIVAPAGEIKRRRGAEFERYPEDKFILEFTVTDVSGASKVTDLVALS